MGLWVRKEKQMSFMKYDLNKLVKEDHPLRKVSEVINFKAVALDFKELLKRLGRKGYGIELGIRALFLQYYYDLSEERVRGAVTRQYSITVVLRINHRRRYS